MRDIKYIVLSGILIFLFCATVEIQSEVRELKGHTELLAIKTSALYSATNDIVVKVKSMDSNYGKLDYQIDVLTKTLLEQRGR